MQKITLQLHCEPTVFIRPSLGTQYTGDTLHFKMTCKQVPEPQSPVSFQALCPGHEGTGV